MPRCACVLGRDRRRRSDVSERFQRPLAGIGDLEQRVELRELEQGLEVVVEIREAELPALLADLLGERHEDAEPRAVDVARLTEVDQELLLALFELVEDFLLQLLSVADDELAFDINHADLSLLLDREAHDSVLPEGLCFALPAIPACSAVMAATLIMSSGEAPRERSLQGRESPCTIGPIADARAIRSTSLYAMFPASSDGNTKTFARPATGLRGALRFPTVGISAASPCNSPSTTSAGAFDRRI